MKQNHRVWLCLPALLMYCCDLGITLASQPSTFWDGAYETVDEGNPLAHVLLLLGPATFIVAALAWGAMCSSIMLFAHRAVARALSFGLTIAHALGTGFWLYRHGVAGLIAALLLLVFAERLLSWSWSKAE